MPVILSIITGMPIEQIFGSPFSLMNFSILLSSTELKNVNEISNRERFPSCLRGPNFLQVLLHLQV